MLLKKDVCVLHIPSLGIGASSTLAPLNGQRTKNKAACLTMSSCLMMIDEDLQVDRYRQPV